MYKMKYFHLRASFACSVNVHSTHKYFLPSNLRTSGRRHGGSLFVTEEQSKVATHTALFVMSLTQTYRLDRDVTESDIPPCS